MYSPVVVTLESNVDTPINGHQVVFSIMFHGQLHIRYAKIKPSMYWMIGGAACKGVGCQVAYAKGD